MSQGSNFKTQVMEALFNAPTNLINNKAIMWALSNLPDEGGNGEHNTVLRGPYQHDSECLWTALGMSGCTMEQMHDKFQAAFLGYVKENPSEDFTKSMAFENIEKKLGYDGILFLALHGFIKHYEALKEAQITAMGISGIVKGGPQDLEALIKHLTEIRKKLGGDQ